MLLRKNHDSRLCRARSAASERRRKSSRVVRMAPSISTQNELSKSQRFASSQTSRADRHSLFKDIQTSCKDSAVASIRLMIHPLLPPCWPDPCEFRPAWPQKDDGARL